MKRIVWTASIIAGLGLLAVGFVWLKGAGPTPFPGVEGPQGETRIAARAPERIETFERGSEHRLAILVTDPDSDWLGLVRGFRAHGVPITVTRNPERALRHRVVLAYPIISGRTLEAGAIRGLADHVRGGGTVLAFNLAGGGLEGLFGVTAGAESRTRTRLRWSEPGPYPESAESVVSSAGETRIATVGYRAGMARTAAVFEDGSVAAACRTDGGRACVLGVDLGSLAQRAMNGRAESLVRRYVNGYEPSLDNLFRWVRDLYVAGEPMPWLISPAPAGKQASIILTHDVDYGRSVENSAAYAAALKAAGLRGTFFVQTKYVKDHNDDAFFDAGAVPAIRRLVADGMEVGSHTVAHSRMFEQMEPGTGRERFPTYRPFVRTETTYRGATVLGELRVSKFLLDELAGAEVVSFRPGRLSYPFSLPEALEATGYRYSSSITANSVMTHLPFQLTDGRGDAALRPVYEFPVLIEDEEAPPLGQRLEAANAVIEKVARDGGVATILIHPNITGHKLDFERGLIERWRERAWMGSLREFGDWWAARDALETDVVRSGGGWALRVSAPRGAAAVAVILPRARPGERRLDLPAGGAATIPLG